MRRGTSRHRAEVAHPRPARNVPSCHCTHNGTKVPAGIISARRNCAGCSRLSAIASLRPWQSQYAEMLRADVLPMRAGPGGLGWQVLTAASSRHVSFSGGAPLLGGNAVMLIGAGVAHRPSALRAHGRVLDTSSRLTTIYACQSDCPTLNGSLARLVALGADPHFTAELLGWHGGKLYARNIPSPTSIEQQ
jgi:hypothetical protein